MAEGYQRISSTESKPRDQHRRRERLTCINKKGENELQLFNHHQTTVPHHYPESADDLD